MLATCDVDTSDDECRNELDCCTRLALMLRGAADADEPDEEGEARGADEREGETCAEEGVDEGAACD